MEPHSIVVVSLHSPKERLWGELVDISNAGVTVRGIDLGSFDDFVSQVLHPEGDRIGLPTFFFPMLRIERIALDEARGSIPSMAEMFEKKVGRSLQDYLEAVRLSAFVACLPGRKYEEPNLYRSQSAHVPASGLSAVFHHRDQVRQLRGGAGIFVVAGFTDGLDGFLARSLNQRTPLGAYLDPIADKLLLSSSYFVLALKGKIGWWLAILVLGRDVLLLVACAMILIIVGYRPFPPSIWGKATTFFELSLIFLVLVLVRLGQPFSVDPAPDLPVFCRDIRDCFRAALQHHGVPPAPCRLLVSIGFREFNADFTACVETI